MLTDPVGIEVIESVLASWQDDVVRAHKYSLHVRQRMYQLYLTQRSASQQAFLGLLSNGLAPSRAYRVAVNEHLVESLVQYWQREYKIGSGFIKDLYFALCEQFLNALVFEDAATLNYLRHHANGVIFLANHQTAVESSLFSVVFSALGGRPVVALSKAEHQSSWIGGMLQLVAEYPGVKTPTSILYMDRADQASVLQSFQTMIRMIRTHQYSALVHVEGTRARRAGKPIENISSALIDIACAEDVVLVPVRFSGGLPVEENEWRLNYPAGFGHQDIIVGKLIEPEVLRRMSLSSRKQFVLQRLNSLIVSSERPNPPNSEFERLVERWGHSIPTTEEKLVMIAAVSKLTSPSEETALLLRIITGRDSINGNTAQHRWLRKTASFLLDMLDGNQTSFSQEATDLRERR